MRIAPADYPTRETALAIISAVAKGEADSWSELSALSGIADISAVAGRCFFIFGYPSLAPGEIVKGFLAVSSARPRAARAGTDRAAQSPAQHVQPDAGYGFTPRATAHHTEPSTSSKEPQT